uniref:Uncharacterized protein n=1 Tax=Rhizophora mucronata TaxID=61149 RepID=A0A2P2QJ94_RHIMU
MALQIGSNKPFQQQNIDAMLTASD